MNKNHVITFFDKMATDWDANQVRDERIISFILDKGEIFSGKKVLDVASGTGILFPDYFKRAVDVTGIDISREMVKIAKCKFPDVRIICGDAETYKFAEEFDAVMIYNAFPHFSEPAKAIKNLSEALRDGGRLTVAHGISEKELAICHSTVAKDVSLPLPSKEELSKMMSRLFTVDIIISDEEKYIVSGIKNKDHFFQVLDSVTEV